MHLDRIPGSGGGQTPQSRLGDPATLTLNTTEDCYQVGDKVCVTVDVTQLPRACVGGQFFLLYDTTTLQFDGMAPGDHGDADVTECDESGTSPYSFEANEDASTPGMITYVVSVEPGQGGLKAWELGGVGEGGCRPASTGS